METIKALNWRYAVKTFDSEKKLSKEQLDTLLESLRLTASSFGLQPWKFIVVENKELREKLKEHAWNQSQVVDASHLIVLCNKTTIDETYVTKYIEKTAKERNISTDNLQGFKDMMLGTIKNRSQDEIAAWNKNQVYIALGNLLTVCAIENIDACPMEGFDATKFNEILDLKKEGLNAAVLCPVGFRSEEDDSAKRAKVRFDTDDIIIKK